jgi:FtsH-binding integral membrane protein
LKAHIKKIHLLIGVLGVVIFLLTGQYMRHVIHGAMEQNDRLRFSTRAIHVYILMSALLHLSLGAYLKMSAVRWRARLQVIASSLIIMATVILIGAFFYEPKDGIDRPFTTLAVIASLTGAALHVFSTLKSETSNESR